MDDKEFVKDASENEPKVHNDEGHVDYNGYSDLEPQFRVESAESASKVKVEDDLAFMDTEAADLIASVSSIDEKKLNNIVDIGDYSRKYDVKPDRLAKANEKMVTMKAISKKTKKTKQNELVAADTVKLHKRTPEQYETIWKAFLKKEAKEFEKYMGYGQADIERIGINEFIDAMDWRHSKDICKYKTDAMHIIKCPSCNNAFGVYEVNVGLCKDCLKKYDMKKFWAQYAAVIENDRAAAMGIIYRFLAIPEFRELYFVEAPRMPL